MIWGAAAEGGCLRLIVCEGKRKLEITLDFRNPGGSTWGDCSRAKVGVSPFQLDYRCMPVKDN